jgi:hypothetical protein
LGEGVELFRAALSDAINAFLADDAARGMIVDQFDGYVSSNPPQPIPDRGTVTSVISVPDAFPCSI